MTQCLRLWYLIVNEVVWILRILVRNRNCFGVLRLQITGVLEVFEGDEGLAYLGRRVLTWFASPDGV